jgi:outer membrane receptor protein involved in Fe transport
VRNSPSRKPLSNQAISICLSQRDKYLSEVGDTPVFDLYVSPHTRLDMTASYRFSDRFELVAELTNLTDEALELYQGSKAYTYQFEEYGPTFAIGFKGRW